MKQLFPALQASPEVLTQAQLEEAYRYPAQVAQRAVVRFNFVSSLDGAATVDGRAGALGNSSDQQLMHVMRLAAQVILVGAGTIRTEGYAGNLVDPEKYQQRHGERQPLVAVISGTLELDPTSPFFTQSERPPLLLTTESAARERGSAFARVAHVVPVGETTVSPRAALDYLAQQHLNAILCEGGPHIFGEFIQADLVDELCLTLSPNLTAGDAPRISAGPAGATLHPMTLVHLLGEESMLFLRYERDRSR